MKVIGRRRGARALTLLELMVAVTILTVIILGLYSMFDRTQSAFRASITQVDVLEQGRAVVELLSRELEQMRASQQVGGTNLYVAPIPFVGSFTQSRFDGTVYFTNEHQEVFFLNRPDHWHGIAYLVVAGSTNAADQVLYANGVGTLARYETATNQHLLISNNLLTTFLNLTNLSNYQRVAEGVVHFAVRAYDTNGLLLLTNSYAFTNQDLPSYLEVELGVLETKAYEQARSILNTNDQRAFLSDSNNIRGSRVHMFVQRIPVRSR
ncbi:MAG: prepilin-type N-terminal cleavage/methylation domain-containing protein [Verrucomicrobiota bacterium]